MVEGNKLFCSILLSLVVVGNINYRLIVLIAGSLAIMIQSIAVLQDYYSEDSWIPLVPLWDEI